MDGMQGADVEDVRDWAQKHFAFDRENPVRDLPWSRLTVLGNGSNIHWLKELRGDAAETAVKIERIAGALGQATPRIVASDVSHGWLLFDHVETTPFPANASSMQIEALLTTYAAVQGSAGETLISSLPMVDPRRSVARLIAFLETTDRTPDGRIGALRFIGRGAATTYLSAIKVCRGLLEDLLAGAAALPVTLCHGDLRTGNMGVRENGDLVFFDWDDAVAGPAGLSLHALMGGCAPAVAAMLSGEASEAGAVLGAYVQALVEAGYAEAEAIAAGLPGAMVAGVIEHMLTFGSFAPFHDDTTAESAATIAGHLDDLMDLCDYLAGGDAETAAALAVHHAAQGNVGRAAPLARAFGQGNGAEARADAELAAMTPALAARARRCLGLSIEANLRWDAAGESGTVPTVVFESGDEKDADTLGAKLELACALFRKYGVVMIENAFPEAAIQQCRETFLSKYAGYFVERDHEDAMKVGDKRYMVTVDVEGAFNKPALYAAPFVAPLLRRMLGDDLIVGSFNVVTSLPGSQDQWVHKDHPSLFPDAPGLRTPDFAINMIAPLVPLDEHVGTTCIVKGSQFVDQETAEGMERQVPKVPVGAALLLSYRLTHYGLGNRSQQVRPILSVNYHRAWFRDNVNHKKNRPVAISPEEMVKVPSELQHLFKWICGQA